MAAHTRASDRAQRRSETASSGLLGRLFYGPPEWFVRRTSARTRRAINFWLVVIWLVPGTAVWIYWRDALWFVGFMSIFALWWSGWGGFSAETPVEEE
jgi:hypothetical protein